MKIKEVNEQLKACLEILEDKSKPVPWGKLSFARYIDIRSDKGIIGEVELDKKIFAEKDKDKLLFKIQEILNNCFEFELEDEVEDSDYDDDGSGPYLDDVTLKNIEFFDESGKYYDVFGNAAVATVTGEWMVAYDWSEFKSSEYVEFTIYALL